MGTIQLTFPTCVIGPLICHCHWVTSVIEKALVLLNLPPSTDDVSCLTCIPQIKHIGQRILRLQVLFSPIYHLSRPSSFLLPTLEIKNLAGFLMLSTLKVTSPSICLSFIQSWLENLSTFSLSLVNCLNFV